MVGHDDAGAHDGFHKVNPEKSGFRLNLFRIHSNTDQTGSWEAYHDDGWYGSCAHIS